MADFSVPAGGQASTRSTRDARSVNAVKSAKTFWQAGAYETSVRSEQLDGMQTARVHPKFLHSNATSHEWTFGAFAELLDNSVDEIPNGCTRVCVDVEFDGAGNPALTVLDNGGGMSRNHLHRMMSFGMSDGKDKGDRIGQYGNGFKTSSIRLGADALVVTKTKSGERSVGLLSFSFLKGTGAEDVIVPIVSWDEHGNALGDGRGRSQSLETITEWTQYKDEGALLSLFSRLKTQGTLIIISNLWDNPNGGPELDFSDPRDICIPKNEEEKKKTGRNIEVHSFVQKKYHGYKHSLRQYFAILYKSLPENFSILLRSKKVVHRDIVADLLHKDIEMYRPKLPTIPGKDFDGVYPITMGFVEEAPNAPVMGINVYHRNRLILCMWEPYNSPSSKGRGVLGVVEVDFVSPTHSKQKLEATELFQRFEAKMKALIPAYWTKNAHLVGYQPQNNAAAARQAAAAGPLHHEQPGPEGRGRKRKAGALEDDSPSSWRDAQGLGEMDGSEELAHEGAWPAGLAAGAHAADVKPEASVLAHAEAKLMRKRAVSRERELELALRDEEERRKHAEEELAQLRRDKREAPPAKARRIHLKAEPDDDEVL